MKTSCSIACACSLLLICGAGVAFGDPLDKVRIASRFKDVTKAGPETVDRLAPELEKQAGEIQGVMKKYKARSAEALPELQADMDRLASSFADAGAGISDEKVKARWSEFQGGLMKDVQRGALDEITASVFAQLKLNDAQIRQVQPIFTDHFDKLMDLVKEGQAGGLEGVPDLAAALRKQFADHDERLRGLLKADQMDEVLKSRVEMKEKIFGKVSDAQVAKLVALAEGKVVDGDELRKLLEQDMKAKVDLAKDVTEKGKDAAEGVKAGLEAINGNTRTKLKRLVPGPELDRLDAAKREGDARLLRRIGQ